MGLQIEQADISGFRSFHCDCLDYNRRFAGHLVDVAFIDITLSSTRHLLLVFSFRWEKADHVLFSVQKAAHHHQAEKHVTPGANSRTTPLT